MTIHRRQPPADIRLGAGLVDTTSPAWVGWLRTKGQSWQPVTRGDTAAVVSSKLFKLAKSHQHCDTIVLADGVDPGKKRGQVPRGGRRKGARS